MISSKKIKLGQIEDFVAGSRELKTVSTTTYTLVSEDATKWLRFTNASGCTVTVPDAVFTAEQELMGDSTTSNVTFTNGTGFTVLGKTTTAKDRVFGAKFRNSSSAIFYAINDISSAQVTTALGYTPTNDAKAYKYFGQLNSGTITDAIAAKTDSGYWRIPLWTAAGVPTDMPTDFEYTTTTNIYTTLHFNYNGAASTTEVSISDFKGSVYTRHSDGVWRKVYGKDAAKDYTIYKSPNGTLYKAQITDLGQWDITAV
jgi:hypothetical protein